MIRQLKIQLEAENGERPSMYWGYIMYAMLMKKINSEFAEYMHNQNLKPISQNIINKQNRTALWRLNLLNDISSTAIIPVLQEDEEWYSDNRSTSFKLSYIESLAPLSNKELCDKYFINETPKNLLNIRFITPCSFKSNENYCIFPSAELILKSLVNKWNAFSEEFVLDDEDTLKELIERTRIVKYDLRSVGYHIKSIVIPAFIGNITMSIKGPVQLVRLFNLLIAYGEYSGIGIKTALGMGGCKVRW